MKKKISTAFGKKNNEFQFEQVACRWPGLAECSFNRDGGFVLNQACSQVNRPGNRFVNVKVERCRSG